MLVPTLQHCPIGWVLVTPQTGERTKGKSIFCMYPCPLQLYLHPLRCLPPSTKVSLGKVTHLAANLLAELGMHPYKTGATHAIMPAHSYPSNCLAECVAAPRTRSSATPHFPIRQPYVWNDAGAPGTCNCIFLPQISLSRQHLPAPVKW